MLRAVPDVNIHISAVVRPDGHSAQIMNRTQEFEACTSEVILEDTERVLRYERIRKRSRMGKEEIAQYLARLRITHLLFPGVLEVGVVSQDPTDDKIIACALEAGADYIITGDPHLLDLKQYRGIRIVTPRAFLEILDRERVK